MKTSFVQELKLKIMHSGNALNLLIALNVAVFLFIKILQVFEVLFGQVDLISGWLMRQLILPAATEDLMYKPWTILTYMFMHTGFFHILFNMLWLFWLGRIFLDFLNNRQFVFTYITGGLCGAVLFLLLYALHPLFNISASGTALLGASASVGAIIVATATLVPDFSIRMLLLGNVKLKYLALAFIIISLLGISGDNAGGNFAHLGGAALGFVYIRNLNKGRDWSKAFLKKARSPKFKVHKNEKIKYNDMAPDQEYIDAILDKISQSGYKSLSKKEKDALFKASKREEN